MDFVLDFESFRQGRPTRDCVYAYRRVSDPSQAERENSLRQQKRLVEDHFAGKLGKTILRWYTDEGKSASKDHEARDAFWRMVEDAKNDPRCGIIAVDEESRLFRDKYMTARVKGELLQYGIRCLTVKRDSDPTTVTGLWQETIEETMAHAGALANREYTLRGMAGNVHGRDPESGWAYKNGGAAPYGWKLKRLEQGRDSKGRPIARTIWLLDEDKANIRRMILLKRLEGWTYDQIRDHLNDLGIPAPRGGPWSASTIIGMLREDMVWTAAGYTVWNKHYRKRKAIGQKFKPVDDWEVEPNAHPAIITEEQAKKIIAINRERRNKYEYGVRKDKSSPYLLTGDNREGVPLFLCGACGKRVIGWNSGRRGRYKYVCSTKVYKGARFCESDRIDLEHLENHVLEVLTQRYTQDYVRDIIRSANRRILEETKRKNASKSKDSIHQRIKEIDAQLQRIRESILAGFDPSVWTDQVKSLGAEKERLEAMRSREQDERKRETPRLIPEDEIDTIASRITEALRSPNTSQRREMVTRFVRQITLAPKQQAIFLELYDVPLSLEAPTLFAMYGNNVVPPRGSEAITIPIGAID